MSAVIWPEMVAAAGRSPASSSTCWRSGQDGRFGERVERDALSLAVTFLQLGHQRGHLHRLMVHVTTLALTVIALDDLSLVAVIPVVIVIFRSAVVTTSASAALALSLAGVRRCGESGVRSTGRAPSFHRSLGPLALAHHGWRAE